MKKLRVNKKSLILIIMVVLVLAGGIFAGFYFFNNSEQGSTDQERWATAQAETKKKEEDSAKFADIVKAYNEKRYEDVIALTKEFNVDTTRNTTERLHVYNMCIDSARILSSEEEKIDCYKNGKKLADSLADEVAKSNWNITLLNSRDGTTSPTADQGEFSVDPQ